MMNHVLFKKPLTEKIEEYLLFGDSNSDFRIQILEFRFQNLIFFISNLVQKACRKLTAQRFALAFNVIRISLISLSTSRTNSTMKSTSLSRIMSSRWKFVIRKEMSQSFIGFRRRIEKFSARRVMKRVKCFVNKLSISFACLIFILILTELIAGSIKIRCISLLVIVKGFIKTSRELCISTSGLLCRSTNILSKLLMFILASNVFLRTIKYGSKAPPPAEFAMVIYFDFLSVSST